MRTRSVIRAACRASTERKRRCGRAVVLAFVLALPGCSLSGPFFDDSFEKAQMLSPEPVPPYRRLVADAVKKQPVHADSTALEISEPRWIERVGGPAWIVCIKVEPKNPPTIYYAYFIKTEKVVDSRTAIGTDRCVHQTFSPFDLAAAVEPARGTAHGVVLPDNERKAAVRTP